MNMNKIISSKDVDGYMSWLDRLFGLDNLADVEDNLESEIKANRYYALLCHLRLCSAIPESVEYSSTQEKLFSKYTDALISKTFEYLGLTSEVISERADSADVEARSESYSFVADAKVFRLSRTAKNQKDFKIASLNSWRSDKDFAMLVCPLYQLPAKESQIYQQARILNVCILSFSHLAILVQLARKKRKAEALRLLHQIFIQNSNAQNTASKEAGSYWHAINEIFLSHASSIRKYWEIEVKANHESIAILKKKASNYCTNFEESLRRKNKADLLRLLSEHYNFPERIRKIEAVEDNGLMNTARSKDGVQ